MIGDGTSIMRVQDAITAEVGDETVILDNSTGVFIQLNRSAGKIWNLLETPQTVQSLCALLVERYDVSSDLCRTEVIAFLQDMASKDLVALGKDDATTKAQSVM